LRCRPGGVERKKRKLERRVEELQKAGNHDKEAAAMFKMESTCTARLTVPLSIADSIQ
jgi:hypothetical protein